MSQTMASLSDWRDLYPNISASIEKVPLEGGPVGDGEELGLGEELGDGLVEGEPPEGLLPPCAKLITGAQLRRMNAAKNLSI